MIKRISIVLAMILISYEVIFSETNVNVFARPKLLWQKKFDTDVNFIAINSDGTKIAVTYGGKIVYINKKGDILWEYDYDKVRGVSSEIMGRDLMEVVMSDDGEYIACSVIEWPKEEEPTGDRGGPLPYAEVLFFNSKGKLLWSFKASGWPNISSNGDYIFVVPASDEGVPLDNYYLLDKTGKKLWEMKGIEEPWYAFMSKDGKYFAIDNTLYDNKKNVLLQLNKFLRTDEDVYFGKISKDGSIGMVELSRPGRPRHWIKLFCIDLKNKKILWEKESRKEETKPPYRSIIYHRPFERYYFSKDNKYLITLGYSRNNKGVRIYDLISGKILNEVWQIEPKPYETKYLGEIMVNGKSYLMGIKRNNDLYFYELFTGRSQKILNLPDFFGWGQIKISENNRYMLYKIKTKLYFYEIK